MPRRRPRTAPSEEEVIILGEETVEMEDLTEPIAGDAMVVPKQPVQEDVQEVVEEVVEKPTPKRSRAVKTADVGVVETKEAPQPIVPAYASREPAPKGIILGPNDPVKIEGDDLGHEVLITQDVYRMVFPGSSKRPSYILLYPRGTKVLKSTLARL